MEENFMSIANKNNETSKYYDLVYNNTVNKKRPVNLTKKNTKTTSGYRKLAIKVAVLVSLMGSFKLGEEHQIKKDEEKVMDTLATSIDTFKTSLTSEYYSINMATTASSILNENPGYDMDTKIYGVYEGLPEYNKDSLMDNLFMYLDIKLNDKDNNYSDEIKNNYDFTTFQDYLNSKDLSKEEWLKIMNEVKRSYATNDQEKVNSLLEKLNKGVSHGRS